MTDTKPEDNATFHSFRQSGKWYATGRGVVYPELFLATFERQDRRNAIVHTNGGKYPGLSGTGYDFIFVIVPDEACDYGFPMMLTP